MKQYRVSQRNLPADVLVLKEIARRILNGRNYRLFRRHTLEISDRKSYGAGTYSKWSKEITIGTAKKELATDREGYTIGVRTSGYARPTDELNVHVFIHELGHMVWHNNRRIKHVRSKMHAKAFKNIEQRLLANYEKIKPEMTSIIEQCNKTEQEFRKTKERAEQKKADHQQHKKSPAYKLEKTRQQIKRWETKEKRARNWLKKLRRREKIYIRLKDKEPSASAQTGEH